MSDESHQVGRDDCYICSRGNPDILERHHIVPKRFGGSDEDVNLVDLCPSCHRALESLYDKRFWTAVGAVSEQRQLDFIVADLIERLEDIEYDVTDTLRTLQEELDSEYTNTDVDVAKASARQKYMESLEPDFGGSESDTRNDMEKVAGFIASTSTDNYSPTEETVVERVSDGPLSEDEIRHAMRKLKQVGRAYNTGDDGNLIRVTDR